MTDHNGQPQKLSRTETHDLSMIIKDRSKVLRAHAEEQAAACMADFEKKLESMFDWDTDETWRKATEEATRAVDKVRDIVAEKYESLGIPRIFAPDVAMNYLGRGPAALDHRREEMRRLARKSVEAMTKAAITKIEKQALDLRTQVVSMGLLSADAHVFLESLAPIEETMRALDFHEVEAKLEHEHQQRLEDRRRFGYG
jgi:hypothetical protein